jgi:hypothetical protein
VRLNSLSKKRDPVAPQSAKCCVPPVSRPADRECVRTHSCPVPFVTHPWGGGGSTTLAGQRPSETKCPDPPANLFPPPGPAPAPPGTSATQSASGPIRRFFSMKQRVPSRIPPRLSDSDGLRRATFGSEFGELNRAEPRGRRTVGLPRLPGIFSPLGEIGSPSPARISIPPPLFARRVQ